MIVSPDVKRDINDFCRLMPWGPEFQKKADDLLRDPWLARKTDRARRLKEHADWLNQYVPEMFKTKGGIFVDIGPGPGESLELARALGHAIYGFDAPTDEGGMGSVYLAYSRLMHFRQMLNVRYCDRHKIFDGLSGVDFVVMRGSIEQVFSDCMVGEPHHLHHKAKELKWDTDQSKIEMARFLSAMWDAMSPGGVAAIAANGSQDNALYDAMVQREAKLVGFSVQQDGLLNHRLLKA